MTKHKWNKHPWMLNVFCWLQIAGEGNILESPGHNIYNAQHLSYTVIPKSLYCVYH